MMLTNVTLRAPDGDRRLRDGSLPLCTPTLRLSASRRGSSPVKCQRRCDAARPMVTSPPLPSPPLPRCIGGIAGSPRSRRPLAITSTSLPRPRSPLHPPAAPLAFLPANHHPSGAPPQARLRVPALPAGALHRGRTAGHPPPHRLCLRTRHWPPEATRHYCPARRPHHPDNQEGDGRRRTRSGGCAKAERRQQRPCRPVARLYRRVLPGDAHEQPAFRCQSPPPPPLTLARFASLPCRPSLRCIRSRRLEPLRHLLRLTCHCARRRRLT